MQFNLIHKHKYIMAQLQTLPKNITKLPFEEREPGLVHDGRIKGNGIKRLKFKLQKLGSAKKGEFPKQGGKQKKFKSVRLKNKQNLKADGNSSIRPRFV